MFGKNHNAVRQTMDRRRRLIVQPLEDRRLLAATPELLLDIAAGSAGSFASGFIAFEGETYFTANRTELWKTDGTSGGTSLVKDLSGLATSVSALTVHENSLAFLSFDNKDTFDPSDDNARLWKSDGTDAGTVVIQDFGTNSGPPNPYSSSGGYFASVDGTLFFSSRTGEDGAELWKSDGLVGASIVKDIAVGLNGSYPSNLTTFSGKLYFSANDNINGTELWVSDGTAAGTALVKDLDPGSEGSYPSAGYDSGLLEFEGELYFGTRFSGDDGIPFNSDDTSQFWKSDGTTAGTVLVKDFGPAGPYGASPGNLVAVGDTIFGTVKTEALGTELWKSDGSGTGTVLVKEIHPSDIGSYPYSLTDVNGTLFFTANDGTHGEELWKSDGTAAGTVMVKDIDPAVGAYGPSGSYPYSLTNASGVLYFTADDGENGDELWRSDGTEAGTVLVADIDPTAGDGSYPYPLAFLNGSLFFGASDGVTGDEPWVLAIDVPDSLAFYENTTGDWQVGLSDTSQFNLSNWATIQPASPWANFLEGDFNGDGFTDIFRWNTTSGAVRVLESNGSDAFADNVWATINPNSPWGNLRVGDFNGDGRDDVLLVNTTGGGVRVLESDGSAFAETLWGGVNPNSPFVGYDVGDFNGDGNDDVVRRNATGGGVWVLNSTGSAFVDELWGSFNPNSPWADWLVGDFNANGNDDIFRRNTAGGGIRVFNSNGSQFVDELWGALNPFTSAVDFLVGDFDGNGSDDILRRNDSSGGMWLLRESVGGDAFDDDYWGGVNPNVNWTSFRVGDFDGDGRDDLARRHPSTHAVRVQKSTISSFAADELWAVLGSSPELVLRGEYGV